ncbi:hypothetical protein O181_093222 [Austropuccinia psidii MF-1]|uniref:Uncharacterized protein n=1 Tax=Austropuccinia psidii MF-1 TaxID=1389203 RepID=A0A9Q3PAB2_9BASI|nr:hypothetical protein [Austropuccinia psidii MF-1]
MTEKNWTPISTQRSRKPQNSASIKGKFPNAVDNKALKGTIKGTSQRTEKAFFEPEDGEEETLDTVVYGKTLREIIPTPPFTFQFNRNPKPEDWKDMDQVLQLHQLLKDLFQWSMDNKSLNLESHWEELWKSCQKICLREISFKGLMEIAKEWNPTRQFRLLEQRETRIRENKSPIQAIDKQLKSHKE